MAQAISILSLGCGVGYVEQSRAPPPPPPRSRWPCQIGHIFLIINHPSHIWTRLFSPFHVPGIARSVTVDTGHGMLYMYIPSKPPTAMDIVASTSSMMPWIGLATSQLMIPLPLLWTRLLHCKHSLKLLPTPLQQTTRGTCRISSEHQCKTGNQELGLFHGGMDTFIAHVNPPCLELGDNS